MAGPSGDSLPPVPPPTDSEADSADDYVRANLDRFTPDALISALVAAGYDPAVAEDAVGRASARRDAEPVRSRAWRWVIGAYGATYVVLLVALSAGPSPGEYPRPDYGFGGIAAVILTVVLGIAFAISVVWVRRGPATLGAMLSVPLVLLVLVGGPCGLFAFNSTLR